LIIKKNDINSIFPININNIIKHLELVNKLAKFKSDNPFNSDAVVLVIVRIESLKESSKLILSIMSRLDKMNKLKKKEINTKNESLILSLSILKSENKIFVSVTILGLTSLRVSERVAFINMYMRKNLIPDVLDIIDPPIIDKKIR